MSHGPEHQGKKGPPVNPDDPRFDIRLQAIEREQQEDRRKQHEYNTKQITLNTWLMRFTGALMVVTLISDGLMLWYIKVTSKVADAATASADAATRGAIAAENGAKAAARAADTAEQSFHVDERPYLVVADAPAFLRPPAIGDKVEVNITVKSIGKTPAIRALTYTKLLRYAAKGRTIADYAAFSEGAFADLRKHARAEGPFANLARRDYAPGTSAFITTRMNGPLTATEIAGLKDGAFTIYFIGISRYYDPFGGEHVTEFCAQFFGEDPKTWHYCDSHNTND